MARHASTGMLSHQHFHTVVAPRGFPRDAPRRCRGIWVAGLAWGCLPNAAPGEVVTIVSNTRRLHRTISFYTCCIVLKILL